ncbi:MAG TPA: holo-ACP synthase [Longilinea sp.]|nr:holo-ACP synthase [Longilinea sp.]
MIIRMGLDLIEIQRLRDIRAGVRDRFIHRVYTPAEITESEGREEYLAGRFAAKEAVAKALGCGIGPVRWQDIEITTAKLGAPQVTLYGAAKTLAATLGIHSWSISISHTASTAAASVVGWGQGEPA